MAPKRILFAFALASAVLAGAAAFAADQSSPAPAAAPSPAPSTAAPAAGAPAAPTTPAASGSPSDASIKAADQILLALGVKESIAKTVPTMMAELERNVLATHPDLKDNLRDALIAIKPQFDQSAQHTYAEAEVLLASALNEKEIVDIAAFFTSPLGKKYLALQPLFSQKLQDIVGPWQQSLSTDIVAKARDELKKKGLDF